MQEMEKFINKEYRYVVVGATENTDKYGYKVLKNLHDGDYKVVGVNPHYKDIEGIPVYPSLKDIPYTPDVAVVVIPPKAGETVLQEAKTAGITKLWFQTGAESEEIKKIASQLGLNIVADGSCIMVERQQIDSN